MHVDFENERVRPLDWKAEIKRVDGKRWDEDPALNYPAKCGALKAVIEEMAKCFDILADRYNATLDQGEQESDIES